jgi:hypothetical protein
MPPHQGLTHLKEYDIKDSNVELIGTEIDHKVKYNSAVTEPACGIIFMFFSCCLRWELKPRSFFGAGIYIVLGLFSTPQLLTELRGKCILSPR